MKRSAPLDLTIGTNFVAAVSFISASLGQSYAACDDRSITWQDDATDAAGVWTGYVVGLDVINGDPDALHLCVGIAQAGSKHERVLTQIVGWALHTGIAVAEHAPV